MNKKVSNASFKETLQVGASPIKYTLWYFVNAMVFNTAFFPFNGLKTFLLKMFGAKVGKGTVIKPLVNIKFPWKLDIGEYVWVGEMVWIDNLAPVRIGSNACISQGAYLLTGNHNFSATSFDLITKAIDIEEGVWIGAKAIVCPGVTCRSHSVLTVASVATKELEPYGIYTGCPAIKIKSRVIA